MAQRDDMKTTISTIGVGGKQYLLSGKKDGKEDTNAKVRGEGMRKGVMRGANGDRG
jgi:hypothetical protein